MAKIMSLEEAVRTYVHDGICMALGGFTAFVRCPSAFAWEMVRQGYKDIHYLGGHPSFCTFLLDAADRIRINEHCWIGYGEMFAKVDLCGTRLYEKGKYLYEDYSHGQMAFRQLAGAIGAPFIAAYAPLGSDIENPKYDALKRAGLRDGKNPRIPKEKYIIMDDPFYRRGKVILLPALNPELGVIHAQQVGDMGTVRISGIASGDKELAFAADKVVVTCEEIVPEERLRQEPERNLIPFIKVDAIVEVPWGAHPSSAPYYYDYDAKFLAETNIAQRSEETMKKWLDEWVFGPKNWGEYIKKLGADKLAELKADSITGYSMRCMRGKRPAPVMFKPISWKR